MEGICGTDCSKCKNEKCKGCRETAGCPFGKQCFIAKYILVDGKENFEEFKNILIDEINDLKIDGMPKIDELYPLNGSFINLSYPISNGDNIKFLDDNDIYLGNQVEVEFSDEEQKRCYGIVANMSFILISEYGPNGDNPELVLYKRR
jgi:hypothetical protein